MIIETQNLTKEFGSLRAVDSLNLRIVEGEILVLLGPNGAGKTTTVRLLASILKPTAGRATIAGYDVVEQAKIIRQMVGFLTEFPGLYLRMSLGDYLDFFGELYGISKEKRRRRSEELMERFGVSGMRGKRLAEFSKGMRQRVALMRVLIHDPQILFLDEPTSAMDPHSAKMVRDYIRGLRSSRHTILLCTHNLAEAESLADRMAIISQGRIIALGRPGELKRQLLGVPLFELRVASPLDSLLSKVGEWVEIEEHGPTWLRYRTPLPEEVNPLLLHRLADEGAEVVTLSEVPRSLEEVYLRIVEDGDGDTLSVKS